MKVQNKLCIRCKSLKDPIIDFCQRKTAPDGRSPVCRECASQANAKYRSKFQRRELAAKKSIIWRKNNPERKRQQGKNWSHKLKFEVMSHYCNGMPRCMCPYCDVDYMSVLTMDHINGGGNKQRKETRINSGLPFYAWIKNNKFPIGFQVLCHNCNHAKHIFSVCPPEVHHKF
jgi:hypothetical protein